MIQSKSVSTQLVPDEKLHIAKLYRGFSVTNSSLACIYSINDSKLYKSGGGYYRIKLHNMSDPA